MSYSNNAYVRSFCKFVVFILLHLLSRVHNCNITEIVTIVFQIIVQYSKISTIININGTDLVMWKSLS